MKELITLAQRMNELKQNYELENIGNPDAMVLQKFGPSGISIRRIADTVYKLNSGQVVVYDYVSTGWTQYMTYLHCVWLGCSKEFCYDVYAMLRLSELNDGSIKQPPDHRLIVTPHADGHFIVELKVAAEKPTCIVDTVEAFKSLPLVNWKENGRFAYDVSITNPYTLVNTIFEAAKAQIDIQINFEEVGLNSRRYASEETEKRMVIHAFLAACQCVPGSKRTLGVVIYPDVVWADYRASVYAAKAIKKSIVLSFKDANDLKIVVDVTRGILHITKTLLVVDANTTKIRNVPLNQRSDTLRDDTLAWTIKSQDDAKWFDENVADMGMVGIFSEYEEDPKARTTYLQVVRDSFLPYFDVKTKCPSSKIGIAVLQTGRVYTKEIPLEFTVDDNTLTFKARGVNNQKLYQHYTTLENYLNAGKGCHTIVCEELGESKRLSLKVYEQCFIMLDNDAYMKAIPYYGGVEAFDAWFEKHVAAYPPADTVTIIKDANEILGSRVIFS